MVMTNSLPLNHVFFFEIVDLPNFKIVVFHSHKYVSLPEGTKGSTCFEDKVLLKENIRS